MAQSITITTSLTPALTAAAEAEITGVHTTIDGIKINLTPTQQKDMYNVGPIRDSEISMIVTTLMEAHPETIPDDFTLAQFLALRQERRDAANLQSKFLVLAAIAGTHVEIVGNNEFYGALQCLDKARLIGKTSSTVMALVDDISSIYFKKAATSKKTPTIFTIAPAASITITGVATKKMFTNTGSTILSILKVGALISLTITINPGSGVEIPKEWTKIVVTNESTTADGAFSLFVKS